MSSEPTSTKGREGVKYQFWVKYPFKSAPFFANKQKQKKKLHLALHLSEACGRGAYQIYTLQPWFTLREVVPVNHQEIDPVNRIVTFQCDAKIHV